MSSLPVVGFLSLYLFPMYFVLTVQMHDCALDFSVHMISFSEIQDVVLTLEGALATFISKEVLVLSLNGGEL